MMKMATGEGSPLRQCAEMGLDWFSVATEASGGRTPNLWSSPIILGYMGIYRRKKSVRGATRGPRGWGAPREVGRALDPRGHLVASLTSTPSLLDYVCSKNDSRESFIPFGLRLVFLFCKTLKEGKKIETGTGL